MLKAARRADSMLQEIQSAEEWIDGFFIDWDEKKRRYHGPAWRAGGESHAEDDAWDPENFTYEWVSIYSSQLVLGNPRVRFSTTRSGEERTIVKAHELAVNRWIRETKMRMLNEKLAVDFGMHRAICLTLPNHDADQADRDDPKGWPSAKRISPRRYVYDTRAIEKEDELWRGHKSIHMKHELLERARENPDEGWDTDEILALTEEYQVDELRGYGRGRESAPRRHEVVLYNIWVRDYDPTRADQTFHGKTAWSRTLRQGAWLTLGVVGGKTSRWLRRPSPYWGHRRGPYVVIDGYFIPDESVGLAQIPAVDPQVQELNMHARGLSRAMAAYKKGILVDGSDPEFLDKIKEFEDHWVVGVDGLDDIDRKVKEIELAGATELHLLHNRVLRDRVNRNGGITDLERGQPDPGVTATADTIASTAAKTKVGFVATKFIDGISEILENVSIYMGFDQTRTRLGPEAKRALRHPQTGEPLAGAIYTGGITSKEEADWFLSLGIEIEPYSMGSTSEALEQQRTLQMMNTIAVLLPMMAQYPFVLWDEFLETLGEMMNLPNLSDYFDPEALHAFQTLMLQGQEITAQKGMGAVQPRLARDVSRLAAGRQQIKMNGNMLGALLAATQQVRGGAGARNGRMGGQAPRP